jgi:hypothetical protein
LPLHSYDELVAKRESITLPERAVGNVPARLFLS